MKNTKNMLLGFLATALLTMSLHAADAETLPIPLPLEQEQQVPAYKTNINEPKENDGKNTVVTMDAGHRTTHNGSNHLYVGTTLFGDQIEMEDGSFWMTNPNDRYILQNWASGDPLIVLQNGYWISKPAFPYKVYNERTYESVEVEMSAAPIWDSFYRRFIVDIYKPAYGDGVAKLNDGSTWVLSSSNKNVWDVWLQNDTIIIGTNDSFFSFFTPDILINVTCGITFVPAKCTN